MKFLALLIALASWAGARAEPARIGAHLLSIHARPAYETLTVGVDVQAPNGLTAGVLRNSERRVSVYAGRTWQTDRGHWALTAGAITGYRSARLTPLLVPSVRLGDVRLSLIPKPRDGGSSALHLSVERHF